MSYLAAVDRFHLGMLGPLLMGAAGLDLISHWRYIIWRLLFAFIAYQIIRLIIGEFPKEDTYEYTNTEY